MHCAPDCSWFLFLARLARCWFPHSMVTMIKLLCASPRMTPSLMLREHLLQKARGRNGMTRGRACGNALSKSTWPELPCGDTSIASVACLLRLREGPFLAKAIQALGITSWSVWPCSSHPAIPILPYSLLNHLFWVSFCHLACLISLFFLLSSVSIPSGNSVAATEAAAASLSFLEAHWPCHPQLLCHQPVLWNSWRVLELLQLLLYHPQAQSVMMQQLRKRRWKAAAQPYMQFSVDARTLRTNPVCLFSTVPPTVWGRHFVLSAFFGYTYVLSAVSIFELSFSVLSYHFWQRRKHHSSRTKHHEISDRYPQDSQENYDTNNIVILQLTHLPETQAHNLHGQVP